ncbi:hypothetical protein SAMN05443668_110317 [Cryptosporangium aurantiacum]|uniref:Uncharacterized protein n=1 Tax=Cryptosporangium aurantiacum TaxID=134849 RepID=A0A1M7REL6_9ACTN|nr:hypothetical protein [Cryptosporangium aurantiacum]SHN44674.1 hypothetical protein SAMN05443668_110317 [Cryptosporangium aurantiacum]
MEGEVLTPEAGGRPFIWLDDEIADRRWVRTHHHEPALLHRVDGLLGLTDADFAAYRMFLRSRRPAMAPLPVGWLLGGCSDVMERHGPG